MDFLNRDQAWQIYYVVLDEITKWIAEGSPVRIRYCDNHYVSSVFLLDITLQQLAIKILVF